MPHPDNPLMSPKPRHFILGRLCLFCGKTIDPTLRGFCPACAKELEDKHLLLPVEDPKTPVAIYRYEGAAREGLHRFKYGGCTDLGYHCGHLLARKFREKNHTAHVVTCVPRAKDGLPRKYNQSSVLAKTFARDTHLPFDGKLLRKRSGMRTQPECKTRSARETNAKNAFRIGPSKRDLTGLTVVIIDDLYTTGATLRTCSSLLKQRGAAKVLLYAAFRVDGPIRLGLTRNPKAEHIHEEFGDPTKYKNRRFSVKTKTRP